MNNSFLRQLIYALIALGCIAADQLFKYWARVDLALRPGGTLPLIPGMFHLTYLENHGAAFGILQNQQWFFLVVTPAVILVLCYFLFFKKPVLGNMPGIPMACLLGGAAGNLIDRVVNGYVVDIFDFRAIGFAVFNVADSCLVCAVVGLMIWILRDEMRKKKA